MYWPSTLSWGRVCWGCGCGSGGPPLVVVIYATSVPGGFPRRVGGVANTGARGGQGSRKSVLRIRTRTGAGRFAPAAILDAVGHVVPLVGRKINHRWIARRAPAAQRAADGRPGPAPHRWNEQKRARGGGDKARQHKKNPRKKGGEAGGVEVNRADPAGANGRAKPIEVAATGAFEHEDARRRGGDEQNQGRKPPDRHRDCDEGRDLRHRKQDCTDQGPFHQEHRRKIPRGTRLASGPGSSMVRPRRWSRRGRRSYWIRQVSCLHT